jgi:hypothetical protein
LPDLHEGRERLMIGQERRPTDRAEQDRIKGPQNLQKVRGHDAAVLLPVFDAPWQMRIFELQAFFKFRRSRKHANRFGGHFGADAVTGINSDFENRHGKIGLLVLVAAQAVDIRLQPGTFLLQAIQLPAEVNPRGEPVARGEQEQPE